MSKFDKFKISCGIEDELNALSSLFEKYENYIINNLTNNILKATKFEENLKKNISHEQTINLIEHIMEKSQFYFIFLNLITDFSAKESLKEKIKIKILEIYKEILIKEENLNLSFFSEDEFKNYLEIL